MSTLHQPSAYALHAIPTQPAGFSGGSEEDQETVMRLLGCMESPDLAAQAFELLSRGQALLLGILCPLQSLLAV